MNTYQAEQSQLHIARRAVSSSTTASPARRGGAASSAAGPAGSADAPSPAPHSAVAPVRAQLPEAIRPNEPVPIWLAVLLATSCEAQRNGEHHAVRWNWASGRALYTNAGREAEHIEPLGVSLLGGHTMAVSWMPGETAYTVEVYRQAELCA